MGILCQMDPFTRTEKPSTFSEYGKMRDRMIQKSWDHYSEEEFIQKVTLKGQAFFGCLFRGRDLMEFQSQKECWLTQTIVGVDFDDCGVDPLSVSRAYEEEGYPVWLGYLTFSDVPRSPSRSFRLLWRVEVDLNTSYEETFSFIKTLSGVPGKDLADKRSRDPGRLWQGTDKGHFVHNPHSAKLTIPVKGNAP